jgi:dephospho-CoA kinase
MIPPVLIIGLTGGIGSGKSTVAEMLGRRGAVVIDVDGLGRAVIAPDGRAVDAVVNRFGEDVRGPDGGIDRAALAAIVFGDESQLLALNEISHPMINELLDEAIEQVINGPADSADNIVVMDMAVLLESQLGSVSRHPYEIVVTVEAPLPVRLERLEGRGMTRDDAVARIENQASDEDRRAIAQYVVGNGGGLEDLTASVGKLWADLQRVHASKQQ